VRKDISDRVFAGLDGNSSNFVSTRPLVIKISRFCSPVCQLASVFGFIEKKLLWRKIQPVAWQCPLQELCNISHPDFGLQI
jgi:hypothetical protein